MDHNIFDFDEDLIKPFKLFLKKIDDSIASEKRRLIKAGQGDKLNKNVELIKIDQSHVVYKDVNNTQAEAVTNENKGGDGSDEGNISSSESEDEC